MDDIMEKLGELLSDEESVRQLSELARMFSSGGAEEGDEGSVQTAASEEDMGLPDMSSLIKLTGLMGALSQSDKNSELLLALKPHLGEEKQQRVDKAIKLLKLIAVWNAARESGLLDDIL